MPAQRFHAVRFASTRPWRARLWRFGAASLRELRMSREPGRWHALPEPLARRPSMAADRARRWRYEGPGSWSAPMGPVRAAWWWVRLRRERPALTGSDISP